MPEIRRSSQARGALHDVDTLLGLSPDVCHVVFLSERSLYILNNLVAVEATFLARYVTSWYDGGLYVPLRRGDTSEEEVTDAILTLQREMIPMTCDLTAALQALTTAISGLSGGGCCAPTEQTMGQYPPTGNEVSGGGTPPPGFTETEPDTSEKCALANWYYQQTKIVLYEIISVHLLDLLVISLVAAASVLLDVLALTAAAAWLGLMTAELGSFSDLIEVLLGADDADLQDILDALEADAEGVVCAMYSANSNGEAGDALEAWGTAAGLSALEVIILRSILTDYVLAGLFYAAEGALEAAAEVTDPVNCAFACLPWEECGFALEYGSGTITYDGQEFTLSSETLGGYDELRINAPCMAGDCDEAGNWCIQVTAYDLDDSSASYSRTFVGKTSACASRTKEYQFESPSMCPLDTTLKLTTITLTDQNPFTVTFKILGRSGALGTSEYPDSYAGGCP